MSVATSNPAAGASTSKPASPLVGAAPAPASPSSACPIAVGFDFDHTLGLDQGLEMKAIQSYARKEFAIDPFTDIGRKKQIEVAMKKFRDGKATAQKLMEDLGDILHLSSDDRQRLSVDKYREECYHFVDATIPLEGAKELLAWLREQEVPIAILTNGWSPLQQKKVACAFGVAAPQHILVSDQLAGCKPDKAAFDALAEVDGFRGRPRAQIIYVGDNPLGDVGGAMQAGMQAVYMDWEGNEYPKGQAPPTHTIHKLKELRQFLEPQLKPQPKL